MKRLSPCLQALMKYYSLPEISREQIKNKDKHFFNVFFIITPFRYILNNTTVL